VAAGALVAGSGSAYQIQCAPVRLTGVLTRAAARGTGAAAAAGATRRVASAVTVAVARTVRGERFRAAGGRDLAMRFSSVGGGARGERINTFKRFNVLVFRA
jgi:hypothetical protein